MRRAILVTMGIAGCLTLTEVEPGRPTALRMHERADVAGTELSLRFAAVSGDSRCPVDVQCVWAGDGAVQLDLLAPADSLRATLHTNRAAGADTASFHGYVIELLSLDPAPHSGHQIDPDTYVATVNVRRR